MNMHAIIAGLEQDEIWTLYSPPPRRRGEAMTEHEAQRELKRRGWIRQATQHYIPPPKKRGIPRIGLSFRDACSFEAIAFISRRAPAAGEKEKE